jgi:CelD/BcsL family acetyltransferase involved in cellulose biosynthesis
VGGACAIGSVSLVKGAAQIPAIPTVDEPMSVATPGPALEARIIDAREASAMVGAWRALFHACVEANPFYGPDFLSPLLTLGGKLARMRIVIVSAGGELLALLPIVARGLALPGLRRSIGAPRHEFIFNSMPLLRKGYERGAWRALLERLEAEYGRGVLTLPSSPLEGAGARGLTEALAQTGRASLVTGRGERAVVRSSGSADAHVKRIRGSTRSKLRRHERDLAKLGPIDFRAAVAGEALVDAVEAFMTLEARGWKGRQGTAFLRDPGTAEFARRVLASGGDAPGVRADLLTLGGEPIGACLHLTSPSSSATFKIAYDEGQARHAPGVLTMLRSLEALHGERWTELLDSGADAGDAVGAVWRDRMAFGDILTVLSPRQGEGWLRFHARARALAKTLRSKARDGFYALTRRKRTLTRKAR